MDYSMDAIAVKMAITIVVLSVVVALLGSAVYVSFFDEPSVTLAVVMGVNVAAGPADALPFARGVGAAMFLNVAKVLLMKRAVNNAVKRDALSAKLYLQGQYFLRLVLTAVVFLAVGYLHGMPNEMGNPQYVNFMGMFFGIFTFPVTMYSTRFFVKDSTPEDVLPEPEPEKDPVQGALDELTVIGAEPEATPEIPEVKPAEVPETPEIPEETPNEIPEEK